jgi:hypothetical protein
VARDFLFFEIVQDGSMAHPNPSSLDIGVLSQGQRGRGATYYHYLAPRLRMSGQTTLLVSFQSVTQTLYIPSIQLCHLNTAVKGKAIPLQACTGPEGSRRVRFPNFKTIGT